jgi:hypothetical protein
VDICDCSNVCCVLVYTCTKRSEKCCAAAAVAAGTIDRHNDQVFTKVHAISMSELPLCAVAVIELSDRDFHFDSTVAL